MVVLLIRSVGYVRYDKQLQKCERVKREMVKFMHMPVKYGTFYSCVTSCYYESLSYLV